MGRSLENRRSRDHRFATGNTPTAATSARATITRCWRTARTWARGIPRSWPSAPPAARANQCARRDPSPPMMMTMKINTFTCAPICGMTFVLVAPRARRPARPARAAAANTATNRRAGCDSPAPRPFRRSPPRRAPEANLGAVQGPRQQREHDHANEDGEHAIFFRSWRRPA